ncbi:hypothetical protein AN931_26400 [Mycobacterium intracellulare subsp. chimaera]|nr:hypothetical protein AN931_26400 [Mycobacterium intracellulare subsp. chimaera]KPN46167.1 hypothetical protein AN933_26675 [Mycobacterium intracellulare subsp. chimaera]KPN46189.1 hypothetical protein AN932_24435 [Mycobacterium intracellulare subsp. chimaera]OCB56937.1 hypothetical protein A9X02_08230 [Mycobacterium malmoense]ORV20752.1 hypothetical protein AWB97_24515 [Mycobacterium intracellulare subsp. chimaera]
MLGGDDQVTLLCEQEPAGECNTVDRRDGRFSDVDVAAELRGEVQWRNRQRLVRHLFKVAAGAECLFTRAGQNEYARVSVLIEPTCAIP